MSKLTHTDVANAITEGAAFGVEEYTVKRILRKAGFELPRKKDIITLHIEAEIPDGMALYPTNIEIREKNGIKLRVISTGDPESNGSLASN